MIFYICVDHEHGVFDCKMLLKDAVLAVDKLTVSGEVNRVDVAVTKETVRRLLGDLGRYAKKFDTVYIKERKK